MASGQKGGGDRITKNRQREKARVREPVLSDTYELLHVEVDGFYEKRFCYCNFSGVAHDDGARELHKLGRIDTRVAHTIPSRGTGPAFAVRARDIRGYPCAVFRIP